LIQSSDISSSISLTTPSLINANINNISIQKGSTLDGTSQYSYFGYSVSLSSDGLILAVGAPYANSDTGYVEIYEFVSGAWTQKGSTLNGTSQYSYFGNSVSLSSDGLILAVGARIANSNIGYVEIYEFVSGAWTQKGSRLNGTTNSNFGESVSLSSDGLILAVGAPYSNTFTGYVKIYEFVSGAWTQKGSTLDGTADSYFGNSVSLSSDGLILAVGAPNANSGIGYVNIYEFVSGAWTQKGSALIGGTADSFFGESVSLSSDGLILAVGAPFANSNIGYVNIYEFVSGAWTQKGSRLNGTAGSRFGVNVSLSSDGLILAVGAPNANNYIGYVEIYEFFSGAWTQKGSTLDGTPSSRFGDNVSLSSDGLILAVGAPIANSDTGSVKAYSISYPSNPVVGQIFYSSDQNKLYIWNGASWKSVVFTS
jgi:hypothetical protein